MSELHENLLNQFLKEMESAKTTADVEALRVKYLGKKGEVTELLKGLGKLSIEERKATGAAINQIKTKIQSAIEESMKKLALQELDAKLKAEKPDHSMPGTSRLIYLRWRVLLSGLKSIIQTQKSCLLDHVFLRKKKLC